MYELAPGPNNPRNSEGSFLRLDDGTILFGYSAFTGDECEDYTPADIALLVSRDGGETWGAPRTLLRASDHAAMNLMSVSMLRMQNGDAGLFFLMRMSWAEMRVWFVRSADGGETWSQPVCCLPRTGYFVMNNDRVIRLASGRILLPMAEHTSLYTPPRRWALSPSNATCFYSDDDGESYRECYAPVTLAGIRSDSGLQEPGLVALRNGVVYGYARTDLSRQYEFTSLDGGERFSAPVPSRFTSPLSPLSIKRLLDGRLLALWNPVPDYPTRALEKGASGRTPLVCALSADDGWSWSQPVVLEDDPLAGYCYTAILPLEDAALLAYCAGDLHRDGSCLNRLRIRCVPLAVLEGRAPREA